MDDSWKDEVVWEISEELDLHTFRPNEVKSLIPDYISEAVARGFEQVRIVHGKGRGVQRRIVHAALSAHPKVVRFWLADEKSGSWGATFALLDVTEGPKK